MRAPQISMSILVCLWLLRSSNGRAFPPFKAALYKGRAINMAVEKAPRNKPPKSLPERGGLQIFPTRIVEFAAVSESIVFVSEWLGLNPVTTVTWLNVAVHCAWRRADNKKSPRKSSRWMYQNFCCPTNWQELAKRPHTLLWSGFSQRSFLHLFENFLGLKLSGPPLARTMDVKLFSRFYVAAIYASEWIAHELFRRRPLAPRVKDILRIPEEKKVGFFIRFLRRIFNVVPSTLGASAAICSVNMVFCLEFPIWDELHYHFAQTQTASPGFARRLLVFWLVLDELIFFDPNDSTNQDVARGSHLGGYIFGILFCYGRRLCDRIMKHENATTTTKGETISRMKTSN